MTYLFKIQYFCLKFYFSRQQPLIYRLSVCKIFNLRTFVRVYIKIKILPKPVARKKIKNNLLKNIENTRAIVYNIT